VHRARFVREVSEDRLDHHRIFDARDDAHCPATGRAGFHLDAEHALPALCPVHRRAALGRRSRICPGSVCPTLAPPGPGDQCAVRTVGCEHAVVAGEVHPVAWVLARQAAPENSAARTQRVWCRCCTAF